MTPMMRPGKPSRCIVSFGKFTYRIAYPLCLCHFICELSGGGAWAQDEQGRAVPGAAHQRHGVSGGVLGVVPDLVVQDVMSSPPPQTHPMHDVVIDPFL